MRKFFLPIILNLFTMTDAQPYNTEIKTDINGYKYETVIQDPSQTRIYTLKNGLKVYLAQNIDEPKIQTFIAVRTGSANDPSDQTGLAHYLEHMMFKGTSKIGTLNWEEESKLLSQISDLYEAHKVESDPDKKIQIYSKIDALSQEASQYAVANEYDQLLSQIGASGTNAHTWLDETIYKNVIPSNELERWLLVEKERFSTLVLRLFHTELETVYEEFNRAQDNDARLVNYQLMDALFPNHPYGQQTTLGTSEHLKNPSMKAIHSYFENYYVPNNMAMVLVGDLDFENAIQWIDQNFGNFKYRELPVFNKIIEKPLTSVVKRTVKSPSSEKLQLAFRTQGANSEDLLKVKMVDMILNNSGAGLIDININQKQKAQGAGSYTSFFNDYGMHILFGAPREGQDLKQIEKLLLDQIEEVKKGNFPDWLIPAIVNNFKTQRIQNWDTASGLATQMYTSFIQKKSWESILKEFDELDKITKPSIVEFANKFYKDNYVVVYKETGTNDHLIRVESPRITPITINRKAHSIFYKEFIQIPEKEIEPQFVDYKDSIHFDKINATPFSFIKNKNNALGRLYYIFDFGLDHNQELGLALGYLNVIGTNQYKKSELEQEFYKMGVKYSLQVQNEKIVLSLHGLEENLPQGIRLVEHLLKNPQVDDKAYHDYVQTILKARKDAQRNKQYIFNALTQYAKYGQNNRIKNIIKEEELRNKNPEDLIQIIKGLTTYKHEIFYFGPNEEPIKKAIIENHNTLGKNIYTQSLNYEKLVSDGTIYFTPYDMVQTEVLAQSKGEIFDVSKISFAYIFSEYFGSGLSSIVFQEIRESKSLAYSAYAFYSIAADQHKHDAVSLYLGTQAEKLPLAMETMYKLMNDMPEIEEQFENAKKSALKQIASQRITKMNLFWSYLSAKKKGLDDDIRKKVYSEVQAIALNDLKNFFNKNIKNKKYNVALMGNSDIIDWKEIKKFGNVVELSTSDLFSPTN
ncbi:insulinase family protein [Apibacter muscae]|uniref:insulinase family protein n=1 Tax=Apibacter muscae TaxID=2509004 RepID=UPI0011ADFFAB|nr:insulinase family protein [Apibacter muscae]TWP31290.1 insulinase family protein [Apibacter muscae]